jgi:hypothetical protein
MFVYSSFAIIDQANRLLTIKINGIMNRESSMERRQHEHWCFIPQFNISSLKATIEEHLKFKRRKEIIILITCQFNLREMKQKLPSSNFIQDLNDNLNRFQLNSKISLNASPINYSNMISISRITLSSENIHGKSNNDRSVQDNLNLMRKSPPSVICVRPLYGPYSSLISLAQFIAYYKINGISQIVFYREETTSMVDILLTNLYPFVKIIQIHVPKEIKRKFNSNPQSMTIQDCHRRFPDSIQLYVDVDEFIFTQKFKTISDYLNARFQIFVKIGKPVATQVPMVLFCNEMNKNRSIYEDVTVSTSFVRQVTPWPCNLRAKPILFCPNCVNDLGIHDVREPSLGSPFVSCESEAIIYHYRACNSSSTDTQIQKVQNRKSLAKYQKYDKGFLIDQSMTRFHDQINRFIHFYLQKS